MIQDMRITSIGVMGPSPDVHAVRREAVLAVRVMLHRIGAEGNPLNQRAYQALRERVHPQSHQ